MRSGGRRRSHLHRDLCTRGYAAYPTLPGGRQPTWPILKGAPCDGKLPCTVREGRAETRRAQRRCAARLPHTLSGCGRVGGSLWSTPGKRVCARPPRNSAQEYPVADDLPLKARGQLAEAVVPGVHPATRPRAERRRSPWLWVMLPPGSARGAGRPAARALPQSFGTHGFRKVQLALEALVSPVPLQGSPPMQTAGSLPGGHGQCMACRTTACARLLESRDGKC